MSDVAKPGVRIGVTQGSTSQRTIPNMLPKAIVVPAQNSKHAIEMFERRELDLFATNKPTLFQMSDQMPGARVLDGRWGVEHIAIAIPRGREAALEYLRRFVEEAQSQRAARRGRRTCGAQGPGAGGIGRACSTLGFQRFRLAFKSEQFATIIAPTARCLRGRSAL